MSLDGMSKERVVKMSWRSRWTQNRQGVRGQLPQNFTDQDFTGRSNVNQYAFLKDNSGYYVGWMGARMERTVIAGS